MGIEWLGHGFSANALKFPCASPLLKPEQLGSLHWLLTRQPGIYKLHIGVYPANVNRAITTQLI